MLAELQIMVHMERYVCGIMSVCIHQKTAIYFLIGGYFVTLSVASGGLVRTCCSTNENKRTIALLH
jgi:hypothetical protein